MFASMSFVTAPLYVLSPAHGIGTKILFAKWPAPPVSVADVSGAFCSKFSEAGAKFFVFWRGDDGTMYGLARVLVAVDGPLAI